MTSPRTCLVLLTIVSLLLQVRCDSNFGPYLTRFTNLTTCKGPKNHDCSSVDIRLSSNGNKFTDSHLTLKTTRDCPVMQIKCQVSSTQTSSVNKLVNFNIHKPCEHFFFGPYLHSFYNATEQCLIKKGTYITDFNLDQITRKFVGDKFFYGTYVYKITGFNQVDNLFCYKIVINFDKLA